MTSVRLSRRRQEPIDPRLSIILQNRTAFYQFEQIVPIHGTHRPSENQTQHRTTSKFAKKTRFSNSSERFTSKSFSTLDQRRLSSCRTVLPISQIQCLTEINKETLDSNHYRFLSALPSRIPLSNENEQRIKSDYPQSTSTGPKILGNQCSCHITMRYRSDPTLPPLSPNSRRDEVTIFQVANDGSTWIVFKGFLKADDSFTFKSQRSVDDRFHLKLEINGSLDTIISACCEHLYRRGGRIDDGDSSFWIETVEQYTSCAKCRDSIDLSHSDDDDNMALASVTVKVPDSTSEESEAEEDQSVASEKSAKKAESSEAKHTLPTKPSTELSSASTETKKPPEKPVSIPKVQSFSPPPSTAHNTTTQKDPSASVVSVQANIADNESALLKYVDEVMQQVLSKPQSSQAIPPRRIGNVENFSIIYIDQNEEKDLSLLRPTVNFISIMNDPNTLGAYTNEKLIVVISLNQAESSLPVLKQHQCIQSIYILSKETHPPAWIHNYDKVIGIYQNIESIRDHLIKTLPNVLSRVIPMEIVSKESTSNLAFIYCQLLKETILYQDDESDLRKDMLAFCRVHYAHNQEEIHQIDEFEKSFIDTDSIQWYTRHCFLTKILLRAFRTQEIDLLFKMRYFIQCLHKQIQSIAVKEPIATYALLDIDEETIRKFQENVNELVLFRSFLPTTFERPVLMDHQNKDTQRYIVFSIRLEPDSAANIEQLRSSDCKIDVLININTIFRIVSHDQDENGVLTVNLESVPHNDTHFQQLTEPLRKEMKAPVVILQLTKLLLETDHYWEGDYITESIYQDGSFEGDNTLLASLAAAHRLLGNADEAKRDFEAASSQFCKSSRAFRLFLPSNHSMLSSTYNNIGSMFYQENHHERAIKFHEMALQCQFKASSLDTNAVATYSANIGAVYIDQKNYIEAVIHLKRAAIIIEKMSMKDNAKRLISIFQKISTCFWRSKEYKNALEYYKKTLDLQLKLPDPLPHPLSVTCYNLSTAYASIGDYDEAVKYAKDSVEYLKMISEDHPELKENQAQLEIVRQKQWLKQVLSS